MSSNSTPKRKWRLKSKLHRQIDIAVTIGIDRYTVILMIKKSFSVGKSSSYANIVPSKKN